MFGIYEQNIVAESFFPGMGLGTGFSFSWRPFGPFHSWECYGDNREAEFQVLRSGIIPKGGTGPDLWKNPGPGEKGMDGQSESLGSPAGA